MCLVCLYTRSVSSLCVLLYSTPHSGRAPNRMCSQPTAEYVNICSLALLSHCVSFLQANPPNLMATIQYVNFFGGSAVNSGECSYWFAQFQTAVTFIQSIDDRTESQQEL
jgi:hypothetical protein